MTPLRRGRLAFACATVLVTGCATMTPEQCRQASWMDVGLRDGLAGQPMMTLDERISDCKEVGVTVDTGRYVTGREQGLQSYCRLDNAITLGLNGSHYAGVCPPAIDPEFRRLFQKGYVVFELRTEVSNLDGRTLTLQHQLRDVDREEGKLLRETEKDEDRQRIRKDFDQRRFRMRSELVDLDYRVRHARDALRFAELALSRP